MKISNPFAPSMPVKGPTESVNSGQSMGNGKAGPKYHPKQPINRSTGGGGGGMKPRASPGSDGQ